MPKWIFWNAKFDAQKALLIGALDWDDLDSHEIHDAQTVFALLDENAPRALKKVAVSIIGPEKTIATTIKSGPNKGITKLVPKEKYRLDKIRRKLGLTADDGFHLLPRSVIVPYALKDTILTLQLFEELMPRLVKLDDPALMQVYDDAMQLTKVLLRMEADGFALDLDYLAQATSEYGVRVMEKWDRVIQLVGDPDFNPRSPDQVKAAFQKRGVDLDDTQAKTLLALDDELAAALLDYRDDFKLHTTYLLGLQREHRDGLIHPNFRADGARTGRMSSGTASN